MAVYNDEKLKAMEDEMNRFEEEIGLPLFAPPLTHGVEEVARHVIGANTYSQVQRHLEERQGGLGGGIPGMPFLGAGLACFPPVIPSVGMLGDIPPPPPPPPPPMLVPHQVRLRPPARHALRSAGGLPGQASSIMSPASSYMGASTQSSQFIGQNMAGIEPLLSSVPTVVSATPMMYQAAPTESSSGLIGGLGGSEPEHPPIKPSPATLVGAPSIKNQESHKYSSNHKGKKFGKGKETGLVACAPPQPHIPPPPAPPVYHPPPMMMDYDSKKRKNKKLVRTAGGQTWEDPSLNEWDDDDFRLFCGDLGNDVTDEMLTRVFSKYTSFQRAKVIRDKRTNKTKGFGFVSFKDPQDFIKAMKEVNGRYVGSRPIKLRKSSWKNRSIDVVRKKEKEKQALIGLLTGR